MIEKKLLESISSQSKEINYDLASLDSFLSGAFGLLSMSICPLLFISLVLTKKKSS